jgi:hypothetical protein
MNKDTFYRHIPTHTRVDQRNTLLRTNTNIHTQIDIYNYTDIYTYAYNHLLVHIYLIYPNLT